MPTFQNGHSSVKHVIKIIENRIRDPEHYPPLRIAVFGGSVTLGRGCFGRGMQNYNCAWPKRFELLVNQFAKQQNYNNVNKGYGKNGSDNDIIKGHDKNDIVKVYNLAVGGTSSPVGTNIVKYWMYPTELATGPDVIINSYSTNDSLPPWGANISDQPSLVLDSVRSHLQAFIRAAMVSKRCEVPPLVVHMDDYLGPQQETVLGELAYSTAMTQMAKWYDTVAISYGDVVRDLAWHEEDETFYNPMEVHFGHWAHQTIAWSMGFASLELLSNYCDDEYVARSKEKVKIEKGGNNTDTSATDNERATKSETQKNHLFLPPALTPKTIMKHAPNDFKTALESAQKSYTALNCSATSHNRNGDHTEADKDKGAGVVLDKSPCIVSWIASPGGFGTGEVNRFMKQNSRTSGKPIDGWQSERNMKEGWSNKIGWIAKKANATFTLQFDTIQKEVNVVTIFFLRSYGSKWKDSRTKYTISRVTKEDTKRGINVLLEGEISGVHNDAHSLTLSQEFTLSDTIHKGESLSIKVDLVSGRTFKIMGMMMCN